MRPEAGGRPRPSRTLREIVAAERVGRLKWPLAIDLLITPAGTPAQRRKRPDVRRHGA
jgi:hypothetical protein